MSNPNSTDDNLECYSCRWGYSSPCTCSDHGVYKLIQGREVLSEDRETCKFCGLEGWEGSFSGQGGIYPDDNGTPICDRCAMEQW